MASQKDIDSPESKKGGKTDQSTAKLEVVDEKPQVLINTHIDKREEAMLRRNVDNYAQNAYILNPDNELKIGLDVCN